MIRQLFHGSPSIIEKPQFGYGKVYNDYGLGFYCTDSLEMAKEWGVAQNRNGYANRYELDCEGLKILDLNCQRQSEIVRKRRRNFVVFRRGGG